MHGLTAREMYIEAQKARINCPDTSSDIIWYKEFLESQEVKNYLDLCIRDERDEEFEKMMKEAALNIGLYYHYSRDVDELSKALWYMTDVFLRI